MSAQTTMRKRETRRKRFPFYLVLSCLIHGVLILLIAFFFARKFTQQQAENAPPPEVTLEITPIDKKDRPVVDAKNITDKAPENAPFQSDQNSKAASELPPEGALALPSQQGVVQPAMELQTQKHTSGEKPASQAGNPAPAQPPSPATPPTPPSPPSPQPSPETQATPQATPSPSPTSTPPPNSLKLLEQAPQKSKQNSPSTPPSPPTPPSATSQPGTSGANKGYQPETRQTVIRGNISNRGRSSVAAEATPIGRYKKSVADAIGSRWYYLVEHDMSLLSIGTVEVSFIVNQEGKVTGKRVVSATSNSSALQGCSLEAVGFKFAPIPPDIAKTLQNGSLEIDYSFTIY
jgi:outer membrane biosynthesis protein TonB